MQDNQINLSDCMLVEQTINRSSTIFLHNVYLLKMILQLPGQYKNSKE